MVAFPRSVRGGRALPILGVSSGGATAALTAVVALLFECEVNMPTPKLPRVFDGVAHEVKDTPPRPSEGGYWILTACLFGVIYLAFGWPGVAIGMLLWLLL